MFSQPSGGPAYSTAGLEKVGISGLQVQEFVSSAFLRDNYMHFLYMKPKLVGHAKSDQSTVAITRAMQKKEEHHDGLVMLFMGKR